jgi:hypothetical protein
MMGGSANGSSRSIAYTGSHLSASQSIGESDHGSESESAYGDTDEMSTRGTGILAYNE